MKTSTCVGRFTSFVSAICATLAATVLTQPEVHAQSKDKGGASGARYVESSDASGTSMAVVVGKMPLAHTAQVMPVDVQGRVIGASSGALQVEKTLDNLSAALAEAQSGIDRLVKVNVYVTKPGMVREVEKAFSRRFSGKAKPAVSYVETKLPHPDVFVAMDGVATTAMDAGPTAVARRASSKLPGSQFSSHVAVLPEGVKVYVSGQAEKGDMKEATRKTMESLVQTLKHLGVNRGQIVQLKAFLQPISAVPEVEREIAKLFTDQPVPPLVFVEWISTTPIEIELIASGGDQGSRANEPIDYLTPPGMKASPVYSKVTRINFGKVIYVSGLYGNTAQAAEPQVKEIFASLGFLLEQTGSDLRHLVKATYYVSDEESSRKLNDLRPAYYDPKSPPAASKAMVAGVANEGKTVTLDMIAVSNR